MPTKILSKTEQHVALLLTDDEDYELPWKPMHHCKTPARYIQTHKHRVEPEKMIRIRSLDFFDNFSFTEWYSWYAARCTVGSPILFSLRSLFNLPTSLSGCSVYWSWQMPMPVNT